MEKDKIISSVLSTVTSDMQNLTGLLALWVECSPMVWEIGVQSQVKSYQRQKNGTKMPP